MIGKIKAIWFATWFVLSFLALFPFFLISFIHPAAYPFTNFLRRIWAWFLFFISATRVKITNENKDKNHFPCIIVANHTSYFDIIALGIIFPIKSAFMAKAELAKIPLFGLFFKTVDIAVNRSNARDSHTAFVTASKRIKNKYSIIIFPEGTIGANAPTLKPFKMGAFRLAIENKIPILPITFHNNYKILPDGKFYFNNLTMRAHIHRAIPTHHLNVDDSNTLKQEIFSIIENELKNNDRK